MVRGLLSNGAKLAEGICEACKEALEAGQVSNK